MVHYAPIVEWGSKRAIRICHRFRARNVKILFSSLLDVLLQYPDKEIPILSHVLMCST